MTTPWRIAAFALWALLAASAVQAQIKFTTCMPTNTAVPTTLDSAGNPTGQAYYLAPGATSNYTITGSTINYGYAVTLGILDRGTTGTNGTGNYVSSLGSIAGGTWTQPLCMRNDGTLNYSVLTTAGGGDLAVRSPMGLSYAGLYPTNPTRVQMVNRGTLTWVQNGMTVTHSLGMMSYATYITSAIEPMVIPTTTAELVDGNTGIYNYGTLTTSASNTTSVRGINFSGAGFVNDIFNASSGKILFENQTLTNAYVRAIYVSGPQNYIYRLTNNGIISTLNGNSVNGTTTTVNSSIPILIGGTTQLGWNPALTAGNNGTYIGTLLNTGTLMARSNNYAGGIDINYSSVGTITNVGAIMSEATVAQNATIPSTNIQFYTGNTSTFNNTFDTLNNLQGDWNKSWTQGGTAYSRKIGALTYSGNLPTNYNTIIYGTNQYGQFLGYPTARLRYANPGIDTTNFRQTGSSYGNNVMNYGIYGGRGPTTDVTGLTYNREFGSYVTGSRLENNIYSGVLQFQTSSGASAYINPNNFTGQFYNAYSGVLNWRLIQGANTNNIVGNNVISNFNLLVNDGTGYVQGYVFNDAGNSSGSGTLGNDGIKNGNAEIGLAGVTVTLTDCTATTYDSTQTDANGFYRFVPQRDASNHILWRNKQLCVNVDTPQGYAVTGASAMPSTGSSALVPTSLGSGANGAVTVENVAYTYAYTRGNSTQQVVSFKAPDEDSFQLRLDFGRVPTSTLASPSTQGVVPGNTVTHAFRFRPGTSGSLNVSAQAAQATPSSISAWGVTLYQDSSCSGAYSVSMPVLSSAVAVTQGSDVCFVVRATVPASVAKGTSYSLPVQAVLTYDNLLLAETLSTTATTAVSSTPVLLTKQVRNVTANGAAGTSSNAKSGETLEYTVTFTNIGSGTVNNIVINETTTNWTTLANATVTTSLPAGMTCSSMKTPDNPSGTSCTALTGASKGALSFAFSGGLGTGQSGVVAYKVKVD